MDWIESWSRSLAVPRRRRRTIVRELQAHLADSQRDLQFQGWSPEAAVTESLRRLGDPEALARDFTAVYRRPRRTKVLLAAVFGSALLAGAYGGGALASSGSASIHGVHAGQAHTLRPSGGAGTFRSNQSHPLMTATKRRS